MRISSVLKNPDFFLLWLGQIISQFGDRLTQMALIGLIYKRAPGSAYELAKLFIFVVIPVFVVGPIAGAYADRWNKKYTMIASDILRGGLIIFIFIYAVVKPGLRPIFPVYLIVFTVFSITRFFIPAKMAIIPAIVSKEELLEANSLMHTTGMIAAMIGFGLGGVLISLPSIGVKGGLLVDAATFFISAMLVSFIGTADRSPILRNQIYAAAKDIKAAITTSIPREIAEGVKYLLSQRKMQFIVGLLFALWSGIGAGYVVIIIFIQKMLHSATRDLGLLVMFFGAGLFFGSVIYGRIGKKMSKAKAIFTSLALGGLALSAFTAYVYIYNSFWLAASLSGVFGAAISPVMISSNTIVYELIPEDLRGRIFSSLEAVMHLAFIISMIVSSVLAGIIGETAILLCIGSGFCFLGAAGLNLIKEKAHA